MMVAIFIVSTVYTYSTLTRGMSLMGKVNIAQNIKCEPMATRLKGEFCANAK